MKVKIKKLIPEAVIPSYAKYGDAGMDLTATSVQEGENFIQYGTGLSIEIPEEYVGLIFPRSSISKTKLVQANSVGIIDSGYRGELLVRFKRVFGDYRLRFEGQITICEHDRLDDKFYFKVGERIAQLMILPYHTIELEEVNELSSTERGEGGFGHTGEK